MDSTEPDIATQRRALRVRARAARRQLAAGERVAAAAALAHHLLHAPDLTTARRIAAYVPFGSEIDPLPSVHGLQACGVDIYLPRIEHTVPEIRFAHWNGDPHRLQPNRFGILEPVVERHELLGAEAMEVILLPLLAFDRRGHRLGSGAGYYDRALACRAKRPAPPLLVGLAYACQEVAAIPAEPWDIPMDAVATERGYFPIAPLRASGSPGGR